MGRKGGNRKSVILGREGSKWSAASVSSQRMIPLEEALNRILATVPRLPATTVALGDALGLVTVETLAATEPIPPFANTGVDGFAVQAAEAAGAAPSVPVGPWEAIRIMTGAPVPDGADAIVMVEDTSSPAPPDDASDG